MPRNAYAREHRRHVIAMQNVAGCITPARFVATADARREPGKVFDFLLARGEDVPLRGLGGALRLSAGQRFRVAQHPESGAFTTIVVAYWYTLKTAAGAEILAWHWTPDVLDPAQRRWPHVHVGHAVLGGGGSYLPGSFGRFHVPTAQVPFSAIIRFAIEELGVAPIQHDWQGVLAAQPDLAG
jgi:hypothetical protein